MFGIGVLLSNSKITVKKVNWKSHNSFSLENSMFLYYPWISFIFGSKIACCKELQGNYKTIKRDFHLLQKSRGNFPSPHQYYVFFKKLDFIVI